MILGYRRWQRSSCEVIGGCFDGIGLAGSQDVNAECGQASSKSLSATTGNEHVQFVNRVAVSSELVQAHFFRQVQPFRFIELVVRAWFVDQKSPGLSGVSGNSAEILASNTDFHVYAACVLRTDLTHSSMAKLATGMGASMKEMT